jgi:Protein of unknown function (DUF2778)
MPVACTFQLNGKSTSLLQCSGVGNLAAFSGHDLGRDNPEAVALEDIGPIPPGRYYIVDRQSGEASAGYTIFFERTPTEPTEINGSPSGAKRLAIQPSSTVFGVVSFVCIRLGRRV